jgi:tRNA (guanine-N7-)-methyltransferase
VEDYFRVMTELLVQCTRFQPLAALDPKQPEHDLDYLTNFERKFRKEGRPIYRAAYERLSSHT